MLASVSRSFRGGASEKRGEGPLQERGGRGVVLGHGAAISWGHCYEEWAKWSYSRGFRGALGYLAGRLVSA